MQLIEETGRAYYEFRAALMVRNNEGLTKSYNRFHDPEEASPDIRQLRALHAQMDAAVLTAYCWTDLLEKCRCEFLLDYSDAEEEDSETLRQGDYVTNAESQSLPVVTKSQSPPSPSGGTDNETLRLGDRVTDSQSRPVSKSQSPPSQSPPVTKSQSPAPKSRRKKPWRYRWPDEVRDEVLARLLKLNADRAEEERLTGAAAETAKRGGSAKGKKPRVAKGAAPQSSLLPSPQADFFED